MREPSLKNIWQGVKNFFSANKAGVEKPFEAPIVEEIANSNVQTNQKNSDVAASLERELERGTTKEIDTSLKEMVLSNQQKENTVLTDKVDKKINSSSESEKIIISDEEVFENEIADTKPVVQNNIQIVSEENNSQLVEKKSPNAKYQGKSKRDGKTEEEQALNDILNDKSATELEKDYARYLLNAEEPTDKLQEVVIANGGNKLPDKYETIPSKFSSVEDKEKYNLSKSGVYKVANTNVTFDKIGDNFRYQASGKPEIDRLAVTAIIDRAQKLGYKPLQISGDPELVKIAAEICKEKSIDYIKADDNTVAAKATEQAVKGNANSAAKENNQQQPIVAEVTNERRNQPSNLLKEIAEHPQGVNNSKGVRQ